MGFLGLCSKDPYVDYLTEVFGCNIIRVPEERYRPLTVIAAREKHISFRGKVTPIIKGDIVVPQSLIANSQMPDLSGRKSRSVKTSFGLKILDGFLKGLGIPGGSIKTCFQGVSMLSFTFQDINRLWIDINSFGRIIRNHKIDMDSPAASIFFGDNPYAFLLLDSVITSSKFTVSVDRAESSDFKFDIEGIKNIVGGINASVGVATSSGFDLTFDGTKQLAFAFSCVRFSLTGDGAIGQILPEEGNLVMNYVGLSTDLLSEEEKPAIVHSPDRVLLTAEPSMVDIE
jgi:hypothetical protein